MSVLLETWNQAAVMMPHGVSLGDHHSILAEAGYFPDPDPVPLPGKAQNGVDKTIGIVKTLLYALAVIAGLFVAMGMIAGMRGRSNYAKDAISHFPYVFGGVIIAGAIVGILDNFA